MITEAYVSFEIAKLLKEKGFNVPCCRRYNGDSMITQSALYSTPFYQEEKTSAYVLCPTHQMAMAWLREVYKIFIYIEPFITTSGLQGYKPYCTKIGGEFMWINPLRKYSNTSSDTYKEAAEVAIKYCLENLI